jgi:hypothetical protein
MTAAAMATEKAATITAVSLPVTYSWKTEAASCMTRPSRPHHEKGKHRERGETHRRRPAL